MAEQQQQTLPERLTLTEMGYHEPLPWYRNPEVDDEEWMSEGWKAVTYEGHIHFSHKDKEVVAAWLADHGYYNTGDGAHYQQHAFAVDDEIPDAQLFNFDQLEDCRDK